MNVSFSNSTNRKSRSVLHLTAHLGGGVGKAVSELVTTSKEKFNQFEHTVICLEPPKKTQFLDQIRACDISVLLNPNLSQIKDHVARADIVQIEWWNHPLTIKTLCDLNLFRARTVFWSHTSGLFDQKIPMPLISGAHSFVFTSDCSMQTVIDESVWLQQNCTVISSAVGIEKMPIPPNRSRQSVSLGYIGTLCFSKLFRSITDWLIAAPIKDLNINVYGDEINKKTLQQESQRAGRPSLYKFWGYSEDVYQAMSSLDILIYLLNSRHYGTAENALVESMSLGVVPIVLDNPAEKCIVQHMYNGVIVSSKSEFVDALNLLTTNPNVLKKLSRNAVLSTKAKFSSLNTASQFNELYESVILKPKAQQNMKACFGNAPVDWFLSCRADQSDFQKQVQLPLIDKNKDFSIGAESKGSLRQYWNYFPDDEKLAHWADSYGLGK